MSSALKSGEARKRERTKYPAEYSKKVDITKVNLSVIKNWIFKEVARIVGNDDDVPAELAYGHLEGAEKTTSKSPDIKQIQYELQEFLGKETEQFCLQLWTLCLSAQDAPGGVPKELLEAKKLELLKEKEENEKAQEAARLRQERDREHERDMGRIRGREREERGRGIGGRRDYGRRRSPSRNSRSRSRQREGNRSYRPAHVDSYQPRRREARDDNRRSYRSRSRSPYDDRRPRRPRSPPRRYRRKSYSDSSRSPPPKRRRGGGSRSRSRSPVGRPAPNPRQPRDEPKSSPLPANDLMSRSGRDRASDPRLSREGTAFSDSSSASRLSSDSATYPNNVQPRNGRMRGVARSSSAE